MTIKIRRQLIIELSSKPFAGLLKIYISHIILCKYPTRTLIKISTIFFFLVYLNNMTEFYSATSSISPLTAILWCFYPIALLVLVELSLGGGFDDDNDDEDGGMLIPAYSSSKH